MADTRRSLSALQTLLADNTSGAISPQDLRDFLVSAVPAHGTMYMSSSSATTVSVAGTYVKAAGTTTQRNLSTEFTMPADNRLTYGGTPDVHVTITVTIGFTTASNSQICGFRIGVNGNATGADAVASTIRRKTGTGSDVGALALAFDTTLSTGDYVELWLTNETTASTVTVDNMSFYVQTMLT